MNHRLLFRQIVGLASILCLLVGCASNVLLTATPTSCTGWECSIYAPEAGALYCTWDAKDADAIRKVLAKAAPDHPTEGPYLIAMNIHSEDLR